MIYLIGYMGVGKTTIANHLACKMNIKSYDIDYEIEKKEKRSITKIFNENNEIYFRKIETFYLKKLSNNSNSIISCGGGTPIYNNNMKFINRLGKSIYLKSTPLQLYNNLLNNRKNRPLISNISNDKLFNFIKKDLNKKEQYYNQANYIIESENKSVSQLSREIYTLIRPI